MSEKKTLKVFIDRIEDQVATIVLYEDDKVHFNLPADYLPPGTKEGDYFQLTFKRDKASRDAEKQKADELLKDLLAQNQEGEKQGKDSMKETFRYKDAGVDIDAANDATARIKRLAASTFTPNVMTEIGSFGGMFRADFGAMKNPVLVSSADGVGTKLRVAFMTGVHNTVGYDLVCHCVNDILVQGARPLFFLDYIASGKLVPDTVEQIIEGLARGCREAGCPLIGGETAEMPGFYADGEYDIAGFIVGSVDQGEVIDGSRLQPGDALIGLPAVGLHTNGYSLARKLLFEVAKFETDTYVDELGCTVGEELLKPHRSYLKALDKLLGKNIIKGLVHITGGGLLENIPRILPRGTAVKITSGSWDVLPVYNLMQRLGNVPPREMYRTFNMGIGMVVVVSLSDVHRLIAHFDEIGEKYYDIGRVVEGDQDVTIS